MLVWSRGRTRGGVTETLSILGLLLMVISIPGLVLYAGWAKDRQLRTAWAIAGPPCPRVTRPLAEVFRKPKAFDYGGARFVRRHGHVDCMPFTERDLGGREIRWVCQFTGPGAVAVTVGHRTTIYRPGVGRPATVTVRGGRASCVLGGWFLG